MKGSDAVGYYAWLRSPLVDGDLQFDNEFAPTFARTPGAEGAGSLGADVYIHETCTTGK